MGPSQRDREFTRGKLGESVVPQLEAFDFYDLQQRDDDQSPSWFLGDVPSQSFQGYSAAAPSSGGLGLPLWLAFFALSPCPELFGLVFDSGFR